MRSTATASSSEATTLSMPKSAMCTGGRVVVRSALPSLVTSMMVPVSAIDMLAPLMPTVASMNFSRSETRACCWMASTVASVPKTLAASSFVRWIAGAIRCDGCVWVSWTIRSPRSVSTTSMPSASRKGLRSISSAAIDLTLVTTMRPLSVPALPAFQQIWAMMSRASAASLAKWTLPPTASSLVLNCSISSGRRSRFALRRCFKSARPFAKSKLSKALSRRARNPVSAWTSARCRSGSSRALLTRWEKWRRDSVTRRRCLLQRFDNLLWGRHRRQAYGPDAHHRSLIAVRVNHGVRGGEDGGARQLAVAGRHLDRVVRAVQRAGKDRSHETVLPRQCCHGFKRTSSLVEMRRLRIAGHGVQLGQRHGGNGVFHEGLDRLGQPAQVVAGCVVEIAAEVGVAVSLLDVRGEVHRRLHPLVTEPGLVGANRRPQAPGLVRQLAADVSGMAHAFAAPVGLLEKALEQLARVLSQRGTVEVAVRFEIGDRKGRVPRRVNAPVDKWRRCLRALGGIHGVVVLVRVLAPGVETGLRVVQDAVEVPGGGVECRVHPRECKPTHETSVDLEHLLEMRDAPVLCRGVAEEAAFDVVVGATSSHPLEGVDRLLAQGWVGAHLRLFEQQEDGVGLRELGGIAEASVLGVIGVRDRLEDCIHDAVVERPCAARDA